MRSSFDCVDVIREAENRIAVGIVVLQRDFHADHAAGRHFALALDVNRLVVENILALVQVLDELGDTALEKKLCIADGLLALVGKRDAQAFIQERQLA